MTEFDGLPLLRSPVAIAAFEGWNDAADASTAAVEHLEQVWEAREVTSIDPEDFYDFQVSRPTITMAEGETRKIEWPTTRFTVASPPGADRDVVLIRGIEPSMRWRTFCENVLEICHSLEVNRIVLLGALLADVPYTRPLPISGTASDLGDALSQAQGQGQVGPGRLQGNGAGELRRQPTDGAGAAGVEVQAQQRHDDNLVPRPVRGIGRWMISGGWRSEASTAPSDSGS